MAGAPLPPVSVSQTPISSAGLSDYGSASTGPFFASLPPSSGDLVGARAAVEVGGSGLLWVGAAALALAFIWKK